MTYAFLPPRDEIRQLMERIYRYRMTTTSGGNLSIREPSTHAFFPPFGIYPNNATDLEDDYFPNADRIIDKAHRSVLRLPGYAPDPPALAATR